MIDYETFADQLKLMLLFIVVFIVIFMLHATWRAGLFRGGLERPRYPTCSRPSCHAIVRLEMEMFHDTLDLDAVDHVKNCTDYHNVGRT